MSEEKVLTGEEILFIKKTSIKKAYNSEKEGFKGKNYLIYAYGANAFAVHEDDDFHQDLANGQVAKVMLTVTEEGWSLANHVTFKRMIGLRKNTLVLESLTLDNVKIDSLEEMKELIS